MPHRHRTRSDRTHVLPLEPRRLMCADVLQHEQGGHAIGTFRMAVDPAVQVQSTVEPAAAGVAGLLPLTEVPALNSRSTASAKLYLDFDGDVTANWGSSQPGTTPAYDTDNNPLTFSDGEIAAIREIFARVAEKFSPFHLNVTTVNPGTFADRLAGKVVIGGNGSWFGSAGGVAFVGGFSNGASNTCFVFSRNLAGGSPKAVSEAIAHEAGHTFGLNHQSVWTGTTLTDEYNGGTSATAPIMGNSYGSTRGLWWRGTPSTSSTATQDDLSILSGGGPGFGYRPDDYGGIHPAATALPLVPGTLTVLTSRTGVIERPTDNDVFSFTTVPGRVSVQVRPAAYGPMLDLKVDLYNSSGTLVTGVNTTSLAETLTATVPAGTYYVHVKGNGQYGDIGQYTISGNAAMPTVPAAPTNLVMTPVGRASVRLAWADASDNETGFRVFRSTDGTTWSQLATLGAGATAYTATWLRSHAEYQFKIASFNGVGESAAPPIGSILAGAWQPPAVTAPAEPTATAVLGADEFAVSAGYVLRVQRLLDLVAARRAVA